MKTDTEMLVLEVELLRKELDSMRHKAYRMIACLNPVVCQDSLYDRIEQLDTQMATIKKLDEHIGNLDTVMERIQESE